MFGKSIKLRRTMAIVFVLAILFGNLSGLGVSAHQDVSTMTDEAFFGQWNETQWATVGKLDYTITDMGPVEAAVKAGDYGQAKEALLTYYQNRTSRTVPSGEPYNPDAWPGYAIERMALLETDNFHFSSPAEYPADMITFTHTPAVIAANVTDGTNEALRQTGQATFMLMGRKQAEDIVRINSKEAESNQPELVVELAGGEHQSFFPTKDTTIISGDEKDVNYGAATTLTVQSAHNPDLAGTSRAYLTFDLSALGNITAKSAQLKLFGSSAPRDCEIVVLKSGNGGYAEDTVTWSNTIGVTYSWQGVEGGLDWDNPAYAQAQFDTDMCRFEFVSHLLSAYAKDKDETYADSLIFYLLDYIADKGNDDPIHQSSLSTGIRAQYAVKAYHYMRNTQSIDAAANTALLKYFWQMGNGLKEPKNFHPDKNFGQFESQGLYNIALYFPEFTDAAKSGGWLQLAKDRLALLMDTLINEDGSYIEPSSFYTVGFANTARNIKQMAIVNKDDLGETYDNKLKALARYVMDFTMPNGNITPFGDSDTIAVKFLIRDFATDYPEMADLMYVATDGQAGAEPTYTSARYPDGKMAFMKTGYDADDLFMSINQGVGNHMQPDLGTVTAYAYGRELLVDPGRYSYDKDPVSEWLYNSTEAHNTIEIDGQAQSMTFKEVSNFNEWETNDQFDFFEGTHGGYANFWHDRDVFFVRDGYWIVSDYVVPRRGGSHTYKQTWHMLPSANPSLDASTNSVKTAFSSGSNLQIVPADAADLSGSLDDGYYSPQMGSFSPAKYASYVKSDRTGGVTFDTVLYPTREADSNRDVRVERLPIAGDVPLSTATALKIELDAEHTGSIGYYFLSHNSRDFAAQTFDEYSFDGKVAYVETDDKGGFVQAALTRGTVLNKGQTQLVSSTVAIHDLGVKWNGATLKISGAMLAPATKETGAMAIYAPAATTVTLNGRVVSHTREGDYIYAVKEATPYPLHMQSDENGSVKDAPQTVIGGDTVTLTAVANPGYVFDCWTGDVQFLDDAENLNAQLTMPHQEISLKANFVQGFTLSALAGKGGSLLTPAIVVGRTGAEIALQAQAKAGYTFAGWTATNGGAAQIADTGALETTFTVEDFDSTVTANFTNSADEIYTIRVTAGENGTITSTNLAAYAAGEEVAVSVHANDGYAFAGWESSAGGTFTDRFGKSTVFTMPAAEPTITATFVPVSQPLTMIKAWEFDHDTDGFISVSNRGNFAWQEGGYIGGNMIKDQGLELKADENWLDFETNATGREANYVKYCMKDTFSRPDDVKLWYTTEQHPADHSLVTPLLDTDDYTEYTFDMTAEGEDWLLDGNAAFLSFGPRVISDNFGLYSVDYVRIMTENVTAYRINATADLGGKLESVPQYVRAGDTVALSCTAYPGYIFEGWEVEGGGTFADDKAGSTVFTAPAGDVAIRARFAAINPVRPPSGGSTAPSGVTSDGATVLVSPTVKTAANGDTAITVSGQTLEHAIKEAIGLEKAGKSNTEILIRSKLPADSKPNVRVTLPADLVTRIANETKAVLTLDVGIATASFDHDALQAIASAKGGETVEFSIALADKSKLDQSALQRIGERPVYDISIGKGNSPITHFAGGKLKLALPDAPKAGENVNALVLLYVDDTGKVKEATGKFSAKTGCVESVLTHLSTYAVGYNPVSFDDVKPSDWYADAVTFLAARNITGGVSQTQFAPERALTRGQFITMIMRAYALEADQTPASNFTDAGNTYYTGYLATAKRLEITEGIGSNQFAPEANITRQDMFTMIYRTLDVIGQLPEKSAQGKALADFTDSAAVSGYAEAAMGTLCEAGVLKGAGGKLVPTATTTRAQMASVLYELLR